MTRFALIAASVFAATAALADAPEASLRPQAKPAGNSVSVSTMQATIAVSPALRPRARPDEMTTGPVVQRVSASTTALASTFPLDAVPRPEARPRIGVTGERIDEVAFRPNPGKEVVIGRKGSVCGEPAIKGATIGAIAAEEKGCGIGEAVKVSSIDGVQLSTPATIDCKTALTLRAWVTEGLKPAVGKRGGGVAQIRVAGSYACRPRNNQRGAKISEHGRGRAIDISGIILKDGEVITVLRDWGKGKQGEILAAMHWVACKSFGTVLGPAADRHHRDHLHFDTASYRKGTYCK